MGMHPLMGVLAEGTWSVTNILANGANLLKTWGSLIIFIIGIASIIVSLYKLFTGLASHGQKQTSWAVVIILFLLGGVLTFGSASNAWNFVAGSIAGGGRQTLDDMAQSNGNNNPTVSVGGGVIMFDEGDCIVA